MEEQNRSRPLTSDESFRASCFMSVVSEDGSTADEFPNETAAVCENRCMGVIAESPTGKEIRCSFAGKPLITYVPDPMVSYMARDPSSAAGRAARRLGDCQVSIASHTGPYPIKVLKTSEMACRVSCRAEELRRSRTGEQVLCQFNNAPL